MTGKLIFIKGKTIIGRLISWATGSAITHVALMLDNEYLVEADCYKRSYIKYNNYTDYEIVDAGLRVGQLELITKTFKYLNRDYDWSSIFTFGLVDIKGKYTCVQLVASIIKEFGIDLGDVQTPRELYIKLTGVDLNNPLD